MQSALKAFKEALDQSYLALILIADSHIPHSHIFEGTCLVYLQLFWFLMPCFVTAKQLLFQYVSLWAELVLTIAWWCDLQ